jgi:thioredoxin-like negative regulator of GroEL
MAAANAPGRRRLLGRIVLGGLAALAAGALAWLATAARLAGPVPTVAQVRAAAAAGRWAEAESLLRRRLDARPEDGPTRLLLATLLIPRGGRDAALDLLRGVPESDPERARAAALVGELELQARRAAEAERAFREAAARAPADPAPRRRLIYLLSLQQRHGEARDALWDLFRAAPDPNLLADLVLNLFAYENDARAFGAELDGFLAATPDDPFLRRAKGLALLMQGRPAESLPHLEAAAAALGNDPVGRFALAEARLALGTFRGDESILGRCPTPTADAARWWTLRGRLQEALGRAAEVEASYREAVRLNPEDAEAHYRLGQLLERRGRDDAAGEHLRRSEAIKARQAALRREVEGARRAAFAGGAADFTRLGGLCRESGLAAEADAWLDLAARAGGGARPDRTLATADLPVPLSRPTRAATAAAPGAGAAAALATAAGRLRLEDVATQAGVNFAYNPAAKGDMYLGDTMGGGVGLIDYDGDGRLDLYFVNGCPLPIDPKAPPGPNVLYRNRGDGTFEDATARAGVPGRGYGMGCAVGDYDNDGHDDLFVTGLGSTVLYRNRGDGTFEDATARAGVGSDRWTTAAGWGDLDGDGDLDLVVVAYVAADPLAPPDCRDGTGRRLHCAPTSFPAQADLLFRNNGDGTFTDVSRDAGFDSVEEGRGLGLAIADLDGDGRLDVFVANDLSPDFLFLNRGGLRFEEAGMAAGVALNGAGRATASMGVVVEDLDADGRDDLFITNFLNEPNSLFHNLGEGHFADATLAAQLQAGSLAATGFGVVAPDLDNDGLPDLVIANGHVDDQPWLNSPMEQPPQAYRNLGGGRFAPADPAGVPYLSRRVVGRGLAAGDLDDDGRIDLVVVHRGAPAAVLRNRTDAGHWLGLRLRGGRSGATPIGARATVRVAGRTVGRTLTSGTSYLSASDGRLWFGLGAATRVDELEVRWPSGRVQTFRDLPADRVLTLREGGTPEPR